MTGAPALAWTLLLGNLLKFPHADLDGLLRRHSRWAVGPLEEKFKTGLGAAEALRRNLAILRTALTQSEEGVRLHEERLLRPDAAAFGEGTLIACLHEIRKAVGSLSEAFDGKNRDGRFDDALVDGCLEMIGAWRPPPPTWVTAVPSLTSPELVPDFARRLAAKLAIPFVSLLRKVRVNRPQKVSVDRREGRP